MIAFRSSALPLASFAAVAVLMLGVSAPTLAFAQAKPATAPATQAPAYEPEVGQNGKDVVWVPTPQALVDKMLDIAKATPSDFLIDLGSGDGRTVITAAKRGLKAQGIEYNPDMVDLATRRAAEAGVSDKATFAKADLFESDFSSAQVITMFLLPSINVSLRPKILDLKPGTRIVSNTFKMGDWDPDLTANVTDGCTSWCAAHLWIVPAKVEGTWKLDGADFKGQDLKLSQTYQMLKGTLGTAAISDAKLDGATLTFTANGKTYSGAVEGNAIKGTAGSAWTATRS